MSEGGSSFSMEIPAQLMANEEPDHESSGCFEKNLHFSNSIKSIDIGKGCSSLSMEIPVQLMANEEPDFESSTLFGKNVNFPNSTESFDISEAGSSFSMEMPAQLMATVELGLESSLLFEKNLHFPNSITPINISENVTSNETPIQSIAHEEPNDESHQTMAKIDINTPPAQDSPKNILNILCDDCIRLILLKLDDVVDFWNASQVCTRFRNNAKTSFRLKKVEFGYINSYKAVVPFGSAEDFLSLFGSRITSIYCTLDSHSKDYGRMDHEENLRLISQYCGQTLTDLEIVGDDNNLHLLPPFQSLKNLKLSRVSFFHFNPSQKMPKLQNLEMKHFTKPVDWLANHFPMLKHVEIQNLTILTKEIFIEFQRRNPQLQSLYCLNCRYLTQSWQNVGDRLPNIVELHLDSVGRNIIHLSALRHLRKLQLFENMDKFPISSKSFFWSLAENSQPIEELRIRGVDFELGTILQRLKTIKVLHIENASADTDLVTHLSELEYLHVNGWEKIDLTTVIAILENCRNIKRIDIGNMTIDYFRLHEYNSIVTLATGRVQVDVDYLTIRQMQVTDEHRDMIRNMYNDRNNEWVRFKCY